MIAPRFERAQHETFPPKWALYWLIAVAVTVLSTLTVGLGIAIYAVVKLL